MFEKSVFRSHNPSLTIPSPFVQVPQVPGVPGVRRESGRAPGAAVLPSAERVRARVPHRPREGAAAAREEGQPQGEEQDQGEDDHGRELFLHHKIVNL